MENLYSNEIINWLGISAQIDTCERLFKLFIKKKNIKIENEVTLLKSIKLFLLREEKTIRANNKGSHIPNYDCLTLSIIICALASRYGYEVYIGRPNTLSRYFHSLIIRKNGMLFKIAGKSRHYDAQKLSVDDVVKRLIFFNTLIVPFEKCISFLTKVFAGESAWTKFQIHEMPTRWQKSRK